MRYIKVLILALFFFFALVFFFQNQTVLSEKIPLTMELFFIPTMHSIPLPIYFLIICGFLAGCLLSLCWLLWDKFSTSAKLVSTRWKLQSSESENNRLKNELEQLKSAAALAKDAEKEDAAKN